MIIGMPDISINGRKLSEFNPVALDNKSIYTQKELDEERETVIKAVLEIVDKYATYVFGNGLSEDNQLVLWDAMRNEVLALKGGEE